MVKNRNCSQSGLILNNNIKATPSSLYPRQLINQVGTKKPSTTKANSHISKPTNKKKTKVKSTKAQKKTKSTKVYRKSPAFFRNLK